MEILENLEEKLITLENNDIDDAIIKEIYRAFHSIKGIAGFASQTLIETIAHQTENILSKLQNGLIEYDLMVTEILINSVQLIKQLSKDFSLIKDKNFNEIVKLHLINLKNFKVKEHRKIEMLDDLVLENEEYVKIPLKKIEDLCIRIDAIRKLNEKLDNGDCEGYKKELDFILHKIELYTSRFKAQEIDYLYKKIEKVARYNMKTIGIECDVQYLGGDNIVDKKILNRLFVPIVQIVRNALTHGLIDLKENKKIIVTSKFFNNNLVITIENNGKPISKKNIERKIKEKNIVYNDPNILNAVFLSGFSTKNNQDIISGRGIGLDIVKSEIEKLNGTISVYSEKNEGTIFKIIIPTRNNNVLKAVKQEVNNE